MNLNKYTYKIWIVSMGTQKRIGSNFYMEQFTNRRYIEMRKNDVRDD